MKIGAEYVSSHVIRFRVWAPRRESVHVVLLPSGRELELEPEADGYFSRSARDFAEVGDRYGYRLDRGERVFADPASRFQPEGPHGPSEIIDPHSHRWHDHGWEGVQAPGQIIYELHLGTFTREGSWAAAQRELPRLVELGVTLLEIMPVSDFAGRFGWGYDGVNWFAPSRLYGRPDDFRTFVDEAHRLGLGVILDVVYNHFGPEGNYLAEFSENYATDRYDNEWGDALNFDGGFPAVRELCIENARYWISEFHLDGLRVDATQSMYDQSPLHVLSEIVSAARRAGGSRSILMVAENESEDPAIIHSYGFDAIWNEDYHHAAIVAASGRTDGYYSQHSGCAQELLSAIKYGFLYQGQWYAWQKQPRGAPAFDLPAPRFVHYLQNHDQVANTPFGRRLHQLTSPGKLRALTALFLLAPQTPHLFQGQEWAASSPFHYFADLDSSLAEAVRTGRAGFLEQFPSLAPLPHKDRMPDPAAFDTFRQSQLDSSERKRADHAQVERLHRELIALRRSDPCLRRQDARRLDGAVLGKSALLVRFFADGDDRLLLCNLDHDLGLEICPEPLLAPPAGRVWQLCWSSEDPSYGGGGARHLPERGPWTLQSESASLLCAVPA